MAEFKALLAAIAQLVNALVKAGAVDIGVDYLKQRRAESKAAQRLADEQRIASALARHDVDAVASDIGLLLREAETATGAGGGGDSD